MLAAFSSPTGGLEELIEKSLPLRILFNDSFLHFISFGLLAGLLCSAFFFSTRHRLSIPFIGSISMAYGLFIEILQYFLPYRSFSIYDLAADALGIAIACFICKIFIAKIPAAR